MVRATSWSTDACFLVVSSLFEGQEGVVNELFEFFLKNIFVYFVSVCVYRCVCVHIHTHGNGVECPCHRGYVSVRGQLYIAGSLLPPLYWFWALNTDCQTCLAPAVELSCWSWVLFYKGSDLHREGSIVMAAHFSKVPQPPLTPAPGDLMPSSGYLHICGVHTQMHE